MSEIMQKLYIEPTTRCNLSCKMCFRNSWINEPLVDMEWDVFSKAMDTMQESVHTVFFGGIGEPLFHPDILSMVRLAKRSGKKVELITNGSLLDKDMCKGLILAGLDKIWISIDTFDISTDTEYQGHDTDTMSDIARFHLIRTIMHGGGGGLSSDHGCCGGSSGDVDSPVGLDSYQGNSKRVDIGITFVVTKSNVGELKKLPDFINRYNICAVNISNILPADAEMAKERLYDRVLDRELFCEKSRSGRPHIEIPFLDWADKECRDAAGGLMDAMAEISMGGQMLRRKTGWCRFVEEGNCFVRSDGDVSPCMGLLHSAKSWLFSDERIAWHHSFGNIKTQTLPEIWESSEYTAFRQRVRNFEFSPCTHCGGCDFRTENREDCFGNTMPTCGGCLWSEGIINCP